VLTGNYLSNVYAIQQFAAYLHQAKQGNRPVDGSVVNITSMSGFVPLTRVPFYSDAFAAIESHTRSAAFIFGHYGLGGSTTSGSVFSSGHRTGASCLPRTAHPPRAAWRF